MLFKDIRKISDLSKIQEKNIKDFIFQKSKSISKLRKVDISSLEYKSKLSTIIYYLLKAIKNHNQDDFDKCFKDTLFYLKECKVDSISHFSYIVDILLFIKETFSFNLKDYLERYYDILLNESDSLKLLWLNEVLITNKYCDKEIIEHTLSKLSYQHENDLLTMLKKNCNKKLDVKKYFINYAQKLEDMASKEEALKAIYFYELAIEIYAIYSKNSDIDRIKLIKNDIPYNLEKYSISLSESANDEFDKYINELKEMIDEHVSKKESLKAFNILFSNLVIPSKDENIVNSMTNQTTFRMLGNITSINDGSKITFKDDIEKKKYLEFENYRLSLDIYFSIFSRLLQYLTKKINIYSLINQIYDDSLLYDEKRESIIRDLIDKHKNKDNIGFNYVFFPTFEYLIKEIMKINDLSPYKISNEEDKTLNKLLENSKDILEKIYGEDFYYLLENIFLHSFGLNMRNALLHGEGISFLDKKYTDMLFFILVVLITYARRLENV